MQYRHELKRFQMKDFLPMVLSITLFFQITIAEIDLPFTGRISTHMDPHLGTRPLAPALL